MPDETTGRMIRWHPGGGRHGPSPYWIVNTASAKTRADSLTEMKMERLLEVLKLMASDYVVQKAALPSFVVVPDEIALLFEDEFSVASASGGSIGAHDPQIGQELRLLNGLPGTHE